MITTAQDLARTLGLIDQYVRTMIETIVSTSDVITPLATREEAMVKAKDALEAHLVSLAVSPKRRKYAYVCNGCGGLYWQNGINCDCNIPYMKEYKMTKVTVVAQKPFNEFLKKVKQK